jgi:hypothetical protein
VITWIEGRTWGTLQVFENEALRKIFGPKNGEVNGEFRILHEGSMWYTFERCGMHKMILVQVFEGKRPFERQA